MSNALGRLRLAIDDTEGCYRRKASDMPLMSMAEFPGAPPEVAATKEVMEGDPDGPMALVRSSNAALPLGPAVAMLIASSSLDACSQSPFSSGAPSREWPMMLRRLDVLPARTFVTEPERDRV